MTYDATILADRPCLYLPLNGTAIDATGTHPATMCGNTPPTAAVMPNGDHAVTFDGAGGQWVEVANAGDLSADATGRLTVEAWIRLDVLEFPHHDSTGYVYPLGKGETGRHEWAFRCYCYTTPGESPARPNRMSFYLWNPTGGEGSGSYAQDPVAAGTWHHLAAAVDMTPSAAYPLGQVTLYKNGAPRQTTGLTQFNTRPAHGTAPFRIGTRDRNNWFQGAVGKVAVYPYVLTDAQVAAHYAAMR